MIQHSLSAESTPANGVEKNPAPPLDPGARSPASATSQPQPATFNLQPSTFQPQFPLLPGETPRAFSAFMAFFGLGHARSLPAIAGQLDEKLLTVRKWSSRFRWSERIQRFNSGLLQQQAEAEAASRGQLAADWARRTSHYREQEWEAAQKLLGAVKCFLDSFGDREVEKMTLAQVSRALQISSRIARQALCGTAVPEGPALAPLQVELAAALKKAYAQPPPPAPQSPAEVVGPGRPLPTPSTGN